MTEDDKKLVLSDEQIVDAFCESGLVYEDRGDIRNSLNDNADVSGCLIAGARTLLAQQQARIESLSAEVEAWKNNADNERLRADEAEARVRALEEALTQREGDISVMRSRVESLLGYIDQQAQHPALRAALGASNG